MGPDDLAEIIATYEKDRERLRAEIKRLRRFEAIARGIHDRHDNNLAFCLFCELYGKRIPIRPRATGGPEGGV